MTAYASAALYGTLTSHLGLPVPADETVTTIVNGQPVATTISGVDALLQRAAADIDAYLSWPPPVAAGPRIDPTALSSFQLDVLSRACVMQAAYRLLVDETDMAEGTPRVLNIGVVSFAQVAPDPVGPDVKVLLQGAGLLKRSGTAAPPPEPTWPYDPACIPWP